MDTILIVDDTKLYRRILKDIFKKNYRILEADDGDKAISLLKEKHEEISIILLDLVMPKKTGFDVITYTKETRGMELIPIIVITSEGTSESDYHAYEYGVADVIHKPFDAKIVLRRVQNVIELYQHRSSIQRKLEKRTAQLKESEAKLAKNNEFVINALASIVEFRSMESGEHIKRVTEFTRIILNYVKEIFPEYNLNDEKVKMISQAAALHDVGKIAILDQILNKPGKLTDDEFEEMKKHTVYGCAILKKFKQSNNDFYKYCYEICRWHHEKYDGRGYPDRLEKEQIPIWAQVVAIADCFDALVSKRVYKDAYGKDKAFNMIIAGECGAFSDKLLTCFRVAKHELFDTLANCQLSAT